VEVNYESPNQWAALSSDDEEESDEEDSPSDDEEESDEELMESLIRANMMHTTATPPTRTSIPPSLAPTSEAVNGQVVKDRPSPTPTATPTTGRANHRSGPWSGERVKKVRFCNEFSAAVPCINFGTDMFCDEHHRFHEITIEADERASRQAAASPLELMKMFGKAGIPDKPTPEELERMRKAIPSTAPTATPTTGRANADRGAASVSKVYDINTAQALEAKVSRSVRWLEEAPKEVNTIGDDQWTGPTSIRFNVANVQRPLAAASKVVGKGNRVVMEPGGGHIENVASGERIQLRLDRGVYVFDVKLADGTAAVVALDSGAGVNVWPKTWENEAKLEERVAGLSMVAANGTEIQNLGQKVIRFKAVRPFAGQLSR